MPNHDPLDRTLNNAEWFKERLALQNISLRDLARRGGFNVSTMSRILSGHIPLNLAAAIHLAIALDVSLDEIVYRAGLLPSESKLALNAQEPDTASINSHNTSQSRKPKDKMRNLQKIAKRCGGKCLSATYTHSQSKLLWECREGHQWEATPNSITYGNWCPICSHTRKKTIEDMQNIARTRGGKCLSPRYINWHTKLRWQCKEGHQWEAMPTAALQGRWCPTCSHSNRKTIEDMQILAEQHGGKCLSTQYKNAHSKLLWECRQGHRWEVRPTAVQQGHWCKVCKRQEITE